MYKFVFCAVVGPHRCSFEVDEDSQVGVLQPPLLDSQLSEKQDPSLVEYPGRARHLKKGKENSKAQTRFVPPSLTVAVSQTPRDASLRRRLVGGDWGTQRALSRTLSSTCKLPLARSTSDTSKTQP